MFKAILTALVYGYTIIIMLGMGASIDIDVPAEIQKSPKAILCGVASQYMFMPLITWGLICAFDLGDTEALSLMLCGMSPGGVTSTFFTYASRANVTLSLLMTTCSTFLALGMMPLLIFVYVRPPLVDDNAPKMNYLAIVVTRHRGNDASGSRWRLRRTREGAGKATETWATRIGAVLYWSRRALDKAIAVHRSACSDNSVEIIGIAALLHASRRGGPRHWLISGGRRSRRVGVRRHGAHVPRGLLAGLRLCQGRDWRGRAHGTHRVDGDRDPAGGYCGRDRYPDLQGPGPRQGHRYVGHCSSVFLRSRTQRPAPLRLLPRAGEDSRRAKYPF